MKKLETAILIQASPERVWSILLNFDRYPHWNPFIVAIAGEPVVGRQLQVQLQLPGRTPQTFSPTVRVIEPEREFRWLGHLGVRGLFDGEHYFRIAPRGPGEVRLIHGEVFRGLLVRPIMAFLHRATRRGFVSMNEAIKQLAEAQPTQP